jgi:outer membrane protein assembly factor BamB
MAAAERAPTVAWYGDGRLYVPYTTTSTAPAEHLVAFEAATGRILYDVLLDGIEGTRLDALTGADGRLYATHSKGLDAFDASTGKHLVHLSD